MTGKSIQNRATAGDRTPGIKQPAKRRLEVRRETLKDLTPDTRDAGTVKGGVPNQTKVIDRQLTRDL